MRTLHAYLIKQILASLLLTVTVFTVVLLIGNALNSILPLLMNGQIRVGLVAEAVGLLIPFVWYKMNQMNLLSLDEALAIEDPAQPWPPPLRPRRGLGPGR